MKRNHPSEPRSVLVFHVGQLGDTVVALPAMWVARRAFPRARFTLLCDGHPDRTFVLAADLLRDAGLFDAFLTYPADDSPRGRWLRPWRMGALVARLRAMNFDTVIYLAPSMRQPRQVARDRKFFAAAGIRRFIGFDGFAPSPALGSGRPLVPRPHEADQLLARLAWSGLEVPAPGAGCTDLGLGEAESARVEAWLRTLPRDQGRPWIGIGPGSKMPAKRWPLECFAELGRELLRKFQVWPVVFGGVEDQSAGEELLRQWGCGFNAAGALDLRAAAAALQRCRLYVGNDTGTMHLAAAVKTPCVAIFSARDWPGKWDPYGCAHRVFRVAIDCEGCGQVVCTARQSECLVRITPVPVVAACGDFLNDEQRSGSARRPQVAA